MRAAEAVNGKPLHGREKLVRHLARYVIGQAALDEVTLERRHLDPVQVSSHRAPEPVRGARPHAGDVHRDLDDLLLVKDHAERVSEYRLQQRMGVRHRLASLLAADVWMPRIALDP